jgi:hypothetical protein
MENHHVTATLLKCSKETNTRDHDLTQFQLAVSPVPTKFPFEKTWYFNMVKNRRNHGETIKIYSKIPFSQDFPHRSAGLFVGSPWAAAPRA